MNDRVFVDTNILVYAHDRQAGLRYAQAQALVRGLWSSQPIPVISVQVLQELFVNLIRKGIPRKDAAACVEDYSQWETVSNNYFLLRSAIECTERWSLSLWDALILAAARKATVDTVWSEDLSTEQDYQGVRVVNPLAE